MLACIVFCFLSFSTFITCNVELMFGMHGSCGSVNNWWKSCCSNQQRHIRQRAAWHWRNIQAVAVFCARAALLWPFRLLYGACYSCSYSIVILQCYESFGPKKTFGTHSRQHSRGLVFSLPKKLTAWQEASLDFING